MSLIDLCGICEFSVNVDKAEYTKGSEGEH